VNAGTPLLAWGAALSLLAAGLLLWSGVGRGPWLLLAGAATATVLAGLAMGRAARSLRETARPLPDVSLSPTVAAFGVLLVLTAVAAGGWLVLLGLGIFGLGVAGVVRELMAQRRETRR
jgi:hypothetical protein